MEIVGPTEFISGGIFREKDFREAVERWDWAKYAGKPVLIEGCADTPIPQWAFLVLTAKLAPIAKSISYGEVKRPIPVMGKLGEPATWVLHPTSPVLNPSSRSPAARAAWAKAPPPVNLAVSLHKLGARCRPARCRRVRPQRAHDDGRAGRARCDVTAQQELIPFEGHGVKVMSIAFLVEPGKAIIWRGPMLHNLIRQFLTKVIWGDLDYLVVDLPPGTGDAPLSLVQSVPLTGAIVVTTPQQVSLSDVRRSIAMFQEVKVPVIGLVENMAGFYCAELGKVVPMFHGEGGKVLSQEYNLPLIAQIPFDPAVGEAGDPGTPISLSKPESVQAKAFFKAAQHVQEQIKALHAEAPKD